MKIGTSGNGCSTNSWAWWKGIDVAFLFAKLVFSVMENIVVGLLVYCYLFVRGTLVIYQQADTKNVPQTISSLKCKNSKFWCKPISYRDGENDAEIDTLYAKSDDQ